MNIQGKVWGTTSTLFSKNNVEVHRITCDKGGYCSKHKHVSKYNMFFVERGKLEVDIWKNDYKLVDTTFLKASESCVVVPGEYHLFRCHEDDTVVYEIYWVEIDTRDIIRDNVGGIGSE